MRTRGFTLIEVMVALVIVGLGMMAVFTQAGQSTFATVLMQERTLASWIATNRITELALETSWPELGETGGEIEFGGRNWRWEQRIVATPSPALRRVDITVALLDTPGRGLHTASAFLGEPPPPQLGSPWAPGEPPSEPPGEQETGQ
jgi:general secretion pathway protein I